MNELTKNEIIEILERMIPDYIETADYAFRSLKNKDIKNIKKCVSEDLANLTMINKLVNQYLDQ